MCDYHTVLYRGRVNLGVLLSRDFMGKHQYRSRFSLPVESNAFSTERKVVRTGEGRLLKQFINNPVHTSPDPDRILPASHTLPKRIIKAVEQYIVQSGRDHSGYTFELIGVSEPSITWRLKRLVSRRSMRYNPVKLLGAKGKGQKYDGAMEKLKDGKPLAFKSEADKLTIDHWSRRIHFILRVTAFERKEDLGTWIAKHQRADGKVKPIDRRGAKLLLSNPPAAEKGHLWFKSTGWYALPGRLVLPMDKKTHNFAFSQPRGKHLLMAYINRGPDNLLFNFLNWPLEAAALYRKQCPPGTVFTEFTCDLRLEIYK
ncbi:MAG: hypothetical protein K8S13_22470 [Desulfobacula sp.]|uniref:hypothetical protein n=1 Tax=Desulfobacula sp. TaxID=2593537 RepID=UPI0025B9A2E9|nr:hypothetical protein [Desulfobacula sp.]MCD4722595.1 hypothetical protein [Desulfobacula sp.]